MRVLVIGSGGREHALAWKLAQSSLVREIWVAPGNGGTSAPRIAGGNVPIRAEDVPTLLGFAQERGIDLTVVGPEASLALGIVDVFQAQGLAIFGPTQAAARLETSKAFAKEFMVRYRIPTARYAAFQSYESALDHLRHVDYPIVLKVSGLAAGKGVIVPETANEAETVAREILVERTFGEAGDTLLIEERLAGPEVSLLAFSDGLSIAPMPAAQDHKRAYDGDQGPNTGGMGAIAPTPSVTPALLTEIQRTILEPVIAGMREEGAPYVGVLYAGLMLTADGPRVLEFNCRFGDPEAQVILPLLETDLADVLGACIDGALRPESVCWSEGVAATIVMASEGYPGSYRKGLPIYGLDKFGEAPPPVRAGERTAGPLVFHAGTRQADAVLLTSGGRVLSVTGLGPDLESALRQAYGAIEEIHFEGAFYRHDIGSSARLDRPAFCRLRRAGELGGE